MGNKLDKLKNIEEENQVADKAGILVSVLCCVHCMAIPFLMIFAPSIGSFFKEEWIHLSIFTIVIPLGLYSFISKIKVHSNKKPLIIGLIGMLFLILGHMAHEFMGAEIGETVEIGASIIGGLSLVAAHIINIRLCRCHTCDH